MQDVHLKRINAILILLIAAFSILYLGAAFLIPITYAAFLAALMAPICNFLEKKGLNSIMASLLSTLLLLLVAGGIAYLLFYQLSIFANDLPQIKEELKSLLRSIQEKLSDSTGISRQEQQQFMNDRSEMLLSYLEDRLTLMLESLLMVVLKFLLILVYVFLFLIYRNRFKQFVLKYYQDNAEEKLQNIIDKSSKVAHHYLWGRLKVMFLLALMYLIAFWWFSVPYATLLVVFGAIVTIIPYLGPLISGVIPVLMYMIFTPDLSNILLFAAVVLVIQLIESYLLEPLIIGKEVRLNPLAVIIAIIIGGMVWGLAGMILFVPLLAIIKIIADQTNNLRPMGYLVGNQKEKTAP